MDAQERASHIAKAQETGTERLWVLGEWRKIPIKRVRSEWLTLNINNRRFTAERKLFENQLGRSLDPENNPNDVLSIESILLDGDRQVDGEQVVGKPGKDYLALRQDWQNRGQESPFWIRPDGTVRNGNRRLAMLHRLHREEGAGGNEYVDAVVLDTYEIDEIAMFEMEQREQLTEDYKVRYSDINLLLAIKDAAEDKEIDWYDDDNIVRIAGELQHVMRNNPSDAIVQLYAVKYMDAYLEELDQEGQYDKLIGQIERFREMGRIMRQVKANDQDRELNMVNVLFAAVSAGRTHLQIRHIRTIYNNDRTEFDRLVADVTDAQSKWEEDFIGKKSLGDPPLVVDNESNDFDSDDDTSQIGPPGPVLIDYPKKQVNAVFEAARDRHLVSQTSDILKIVKEVNRRLIFLANSNTDRLVDALSNHDDSKLRDEVNSMLNWFAEYQSSLR